MTLDHGVHQLARRKIKVSRSTVQRRLHAAAVQYRTTIKKPLLTQEHIEKRLRWANENLTTDWSKVIYNVESLFWLSNPLTHIWCRRGSRTVVRTVKQVVLWIQKIHIYGAFCEWLLLEDNDPEYKGNLCEDWKDEKGIEQMDWPPQSPDCNPIENVWSVIKEGLKGKRFQNLNELSTFIKRQWNSFPKDYAQNLSQSMPSRCARVIEKQGDWIKY